MKAIKATLGTSHPVITEAEFRTIFYKIPELHLLHSNFLEGLKRHGQKWDNKLGECFKNMVNVWELYGKRFHYKQIFLGCKLDDIRCFSWKLRKGNRYRS